MTEQFGGSWGVNSAGAIFDERLDDNSFAYSMSLCVEIDRCDSFDWAEGRHAGERCIVRGCGNSAHFVFSLITITMKPAEIECLAQRESYERDAARIDEDGTALSAVAIIEFFLEARSFSRSAARKRTRPARSQQGRRRAPSRKMSSSPCKTTLEPP